MLVSSLAVLVLINLFQVQSRAPPVCTWKSNVAGAEFDLRPLMYDTNSDKKCAKIKDGDIPCTPEIEPSYGYVWNFCTDVNKASLPNSCNVQGKNGVVLQFSPNEGPDCFILGHYDSSSHELKYELLDPTDPTKGVSVTYPPGEKCHKNDKQRSATIKVECANIDSRSLAANEPSHCEYHLSMKSYYGCPTSCPITGNGLCNSHGHCALDKKSQKSYCFCNDGYYGSDCTSTTDPSKKKAYDGFSVQIAFLVTLLVVALSLTGGLFYFGFQIVEFRKQQIGSQYHMLGGAENEMVTSSIDFR